jgi:hypothetical protein
MKITIIDEFVFKSTYALPVLHCTEPYFRVARAEILINKRAGQAKRRPGKILMHT